MATAQQVAAMMLGAMAGDARRARVQNPMWSNCRCLLLSAAVCVPFVVFHLLELLRQEGSTQVPAVSLCSFQPLKPQFLDVCNLLAFRECCSLGTSC